MTLVYMNKIATLLFLFCVSPFVAAEPPLVAAEPPARPVIGAYTGWEPIRKVFGEDGGDCFRLHRITIRGDVIELYGRPVVIKNRGLAYSASEGGFLTYRGKFYEKDGKLRVKFKHITEYAPEEEMEDYGGRLAKADLAILGINPVSFRMGGIVYTLQGFAPRSEETNKTQK